MRIIQLTAENLKKLTAVAISPDGNIVQITGKNGQGKTSVLDAIWWALAGSENIQSKPIRKGADTARIELKLGDGNAVKLIVERKFTSMGSSLAVKTADGAKYSSPQKLIDDLLGALTFDPLGFMREDAKTQFETMRRLVKLDCDVDALDTANRTDYEKRTSVNRDAKSKRAQVAGIAFPADLPAEPIDETQLLQAMTDAAAHNTELEARKGRRADAVNSIAFRRQEANRVRAEAAALMKRAKAMESQAEEHEAETAKLETRLAEAPALPDPIDVAALRTKVEDARKINAHVANRDRRAATEKEAADLEAQATALTKAMEDREKAKRETIAKAQMPVDGLGFGDGMVTFNGLPLEQASDAEQLMVSTAIAAALNPKLRVLRIRDGSLLDDEAMQCLAKFADERDFQIWIEKVDGSGTVGFVMEDGHVKGQEPKTETAGAAAAE